MSKIKKYLLFTFISAWIIQIIGSRDLNTGTEAGMMSFGSSLALCMFMPALGVFIAGANIRDMGWRLNIDKNAKLVLFAWLMPTVFQIIGAIMYFNVFPDDLSIPGSILEHMEPQLYEEFKNGESSFWGYAAKEIFYSLTSFFTFLGIVLGLGEEIGWRGYLYPELKERFGKIKGVLLGGVIHGAWHFPVMLLAGYEYGREYIGAPLLGLFAFCVFTVSTGIISFWLYERSESIWLPAISHGLVNATFNPYIFRGDEHPGRTIFGPANIGLVSVIPIVVFAAGILFFEYKKESEEYCSDDDTVQISDE